MELTQWQNLYIGLSEKKDGPMKYSADNRFLYFKKNNLENKIIIAAGLIHENRVIKVEDFDKSQAIPDCDALITNQSKYLLTITVADCLPIYFYDKHKKVIALAHGGWRGVAANIVGEVIKAFIKNYHSNPNDIEVYVGPHIRDCHFEVKADVSNQFKITESVVRNEKIYLNLARIVKNQLLELNIKADNINISEECTYCLREKYFSSRRDKRPVLETMIAYIGLG